MRYSLNIFLGEMDSKKNRLVECVSGIDNVPACRIYSSFLNIKERNFINFSRLILQKRYNFEFSLFQKNQSLSVGLLEIYSKEDPWIQTNYEISNKKHTS